MTAKFYLFIANATIMMSCCALLAEETFQSKIEGARKNLVEFDKGASADYLDAALSAASGIAEDHTAADWTARREAKLLLILDILKSATRALDPRFDPEKLFMLSPPSVPGYESRTYGAVPSTEINDPGLRKIHEAKVKDYVAKRIHHERQYSTFEFKRQAHEAVEKFVKRSYPGPERKEAVKLVDRTISDATLRNSLNIK